MIKAVNEAPKRFKSFEYEKVRTTTLSAEKLDLEAKLSPIHNSWCISRLSINYDRWKDQRNRPLINVIAQSPKGAMFFKAVDCEGQMKDSQFIVVILIEAIELVVPENVFQVVKTRFASHIIVLTRLMQVKDALQSMVCNSLWNHWRQPQSDRAQAVKKLVVDDKWWDRVEYLLAFTKPIVDLLRMFDTDMPNLGETNEGINSMIEKIRVVINAKENGPNKFFYREVKYILTKRWNKMNTPLHLLVYAVNPKYYAAELLSDPKRTTPSKESKVS